MGGLLGGSKSKQSSTQTVTVPSWLDTQNKDLVSRAVEASNKTYTPYTGNRIADFNTDDLAAMQGIRDTQGKYQSSIDNAITGANTLFSRVNGPTSQELQALMNPYTQNVIDVSKRNAIQDWQTQDSEARRREALAGAFGGSRSAVAQAQRSKDLETNLSDMQVKGLADAYNNAMSQYNTGTGTLLSGITSSLNAANSGQQYNLNDLQSLLKSGELQRNQQQQEEDFNYNEFDRQQAYPYEQVNFLANVLNPMTNSYRGGTTIGTTKSGSGSPLGTILGVAQTAAAFLADGGEVKTREQLAKEALTQSNYPSYNPFPQLPQASQESGSGNMLSGLTELAKSEGIQNLFRGDHSVSTGDKVMDSAYNNVWAAQNAAMSGGSGSSWLGQLGHFFGLADGGSVPSNGYLQQYLQDQKNIDFAEQKRKEARDYYLNMINKDSSPLSKGALQTLSAAAQLMPMTGGAMNSADQYINKQLGWLTSSPSEYAAVTGDTGKPNVPATTPDQATNMKAKAAAILGKPNMPPSDDAEFDKYREQMRASNQQAVSNPGMELPGANKDYTQYMPAQNVSEINQPVPVGQQPEVQTKQPAMPEDDGLKIFGHKVNMPLLIAGLTMLGTEGNFGEQAKASAMAGLNAYRQEKLDKQQAFKNALDLAKQEAANKRVEAYVRQVERQGGLTPYQKGMLDIQHERLKLMKQKIEQGIDPTLTGEINPFEGMDPNEFTNIINALGSTGSN